MVKKPEPMRGTLPNTDQLRSPHSEYLHSMASTARLELRMREITMGFKSIWQGAKGVLNHHQNEA